MDLAEPQRIIRAILDATAQRVIGQEQLRLRLLIALICDGHVLLEGVPGLGKTLAIKALAESIQASFHRIQFTPDLLPADLIGTEIYRPQSASFEVRRGPVFANFVLADEINRAPAKVQSALLETMQEHQVTIGQETFKVPQPYFVMATQNPIEQEGTYPLPEAQVDRFLMKVSVGYPSPSEEFQILEHVDQGRDRGERRVPAATINDVLLLRDHVRQVYVDEAVRRYCVSLVDTTRHPEKAKRNRNELSRSIQIGASPRASIALFLCARALAFVQGQTYATPQHVKDVAHDVLAHRLILSFEAEAEGTNTRSVVSQLLEAVEVP